MLEILAHLALPYCSCKACSTFFGEKRICTPNGEDASMMHLRQPSRSLISTTLHGSATRTITTDSAGF